MSRPVGILFVSPVILLIALIGAFQLDYTYIIITTVHGGFQSKIHFSERSVGLTYLDSGKYKIIPLHHQLDSRFYVAHLRTAKRSTQKKNLREPLYLQLVFWL